jgi:hypothetical protein
VLIDVNGDGLNLTSAQEGVMFAPDSSGQLLRTAWATAHSDDAFLVLDRNGNAMIDDGTERNRLAAPRRNPRRPQANSSTVFWRAPFMTSPNTAETMTSGLMPETRFLPGSNCGKTTITTAFPKRTNYNLYLCRRFG